MDIFRKVQNVEMSHGVQFTVGKAKETGIDEKRQPRQYRKRTNLIPDPAAAAFVCAYR